MMSKEETVVQKPKVDNTVLVYVASRQFPAKQCLQVTEENILSLANLTAKEEFADLEGRLKEVREQNALVMNAFMEIRIRSGNYRYVVIFAGCEVMVCLCGHNELAKSMGSAVKSVFSVGDSNEILNVPWMEHNFVPEDAVCTFNTGHVSIDDKFATVTLSGKALKELLQVSVQALSDKLNKATAVMYGPVEELVSEEVTFEH